MLAGVATGLVGGLALARRAWDGEARSWRALARRAVAANTATQRRYHTVALRYNHLVGATKRSQATLVHALQQAQQAPPAPLYVPSPVTYRTVAAPASAG